MRELASNSSEIIKDLNAKNYELVIQFDDIQSENTELFERCNELIKENKKLKEEIIIYKKYKPNKNLHLNQISNYERELEAIQSENQELEKNMRIIKEQNNELERNKKGGGEEDINLVGALIKMYEGKDKLYENISKLNYEKDKLFRQKEKLQKQIKIFEEISYNLLSNLANAEIHTILEDFGSSYMKMHEEFELKGMKCTIKKDREARARGTDIYGSIIDHIDKCVLFHDNAKQLQKLGLCTYDQIREMIHSSFGDQLILVSGDRGKYIEKVIELIVAISKTLKLKLREIEVLQVLIPTEIYQTKLFKRYFPNNP